MNQILEKEIEEYLLSQCRRHGLLCWKFVSPSRAGVPDRIVIAKSRTFFVEVKRPGGRLSKLQSLTHAKMRAHGAQVYVVDGKAGVDAMVSELASSAETVPHTG